MLWVKHAPLSCILVRKKVKDTLIFSAFAFNFVTFFSSSDGIIFAIFQTLYKVFSFESHSSLSTCSFPLQLQDEVLVSDTDRLSMTHSNVKKVWLHMDVFICASITHF